MQKISGLNGVRAIAVAGVVWHHSPHPGSGLALLDNGFLGVDVFFVLSGFLITTLLLRERAGTGRIALGAFYVRRSLRIFPLYFAVLALLGGYYALRGDTAFLRELPFHAFYVSNWFESDSILGITWSLSTEEQFYLVWPPVLALLGLRSVPLLLAFLALNQAVNFGFLDAVLARHELNILQVTFTPIVLGCLLAFALQRHEARLRRLLPPAATIALLGVMIVVASLGEMHGARRLAFHLATTAFLAGIALHPGSALVRALDWRPLAWISTVSYGVYLLHLLVLHFLAGIPPALQFVAGFALTVVLASASFRYFEASLLRVKERYRPAAPAGVSVSVR